MYLTYEEHIERGQVALDNMNSNAEVAAVMLEYGYDADRIQHGYDLLETAKEAYVTYVQEKGEQREATRAFEDAKKHTHVEYMKLLTLVRRSLRDRDELLSQLGATGRRKKDFAGWAQQIRQFCATAIEKPAVLESLSRYRRTADHFREVLDLLEETERLNSEQQVEIGETREAFKVVETAFEALDAFMDELEDVMEVAYYGQPRKLVRFRPE